MAEVKAQCSSCGGTGLYQGMCEPSGTAVICLTCSGSGCERIRYTPYEGRKIKRNVSSISRSRGSFIATGVGAVGKSMTYQEFKQTIPEG
jgi:DnaJ-class molecular chaperone